MPVLATLDLTMLDREGLRLLVDTRILGVSDPAFAEAARRSLSAARFAPARAEGGAVASRIQWPIAFNAISALASSSGTVADADQVVRNLQDLVRKVDRVRSVEAETLTALMQQLSAVAAQTSAVAAQTPVVAAQAATVAEAVVSLKRARSESLPRKIPDATVREAIARHQPGVLARGIGDDHYVWFLVGLEGEVRRSGIAQKRDKDGFSSTDVVAELAERAPGTGYEFMQLSFLLGAGPDGEDIAFAWIVAKDREQQSEQ
jgi:hypothetical protein